jgi:hypothetical protein
MVPMRKHIVLLLELCTAEFTGNDRSVLAHTVHHQRNNEGTLLRV